MNFQPILLETTTSVLDFEYLIGIVPNLDPTIHATHPDYLDLRAQPDSQIGIGEVKKLVEWSSKKPMMAKVKLAFLPNATELTHHAQNALLKILEEPPAFTLIILQAKNINHLLPTVRSRLKHLKLSQESNQENFKFPEVDQLLTGTFLENSKLIEKLSGLSRRDIEQFLQELLTKVIKSEFSPALKTELASNIKTFIHSIRSGGNQRLTLQALAISINQSLQFLPNLDE